MDAQTFLDLWSLQDEDPKILKKVSAQIHGTLETLDFIKLVKKLSSPTLRKFIKVRDEALQLELFFYKFAWRGHDQYISFSDENINVFNPKTMIFLRGPIRKG